MWITNTFKTYEFADIGKDDIINITKKVLSKMILLTLQKSTFKDEIINITKKYFQRWYY